VNIKNIFLNLSIFEAIAKGGNWLLLAILPFFIEPKTYGNIVLLSSYLLFVSSVGALGQNTVILRYIDSSNTKNIPYNLLISLLGTILTYLVMLLWGKLDNSYHLLLFFTAILYTSYSLHIALARKTATASEFGWIRISYAFARLLIGFLLIVVFEQAVYYLVAELLALIFGLFVKKTIFKTFTGFSGSFRNGYFKKSLRFGTPLTLHALTSFVLAYSDRLILSIYLPIVVVGQYGALYTFASSLTFIYVILAVKWEVVIYNAKTIELAENYANKFLRQCLILGGAVSLGVVIFYNYFLSKMHYGEQDSLISFILVLLGHLIMPFFFKMNYLLAKIEKTYLITISSLIAAIINIAMNFYLIPTKGVMGAALSTLISYFTLYAISMTLYHFNDFRSKKR